MSDRMDLDAILAEFHAEERQKTAAKQTPSAQPRRVPRADVPARTQQPAPAPRRMAPEPPPVQAPATAAERPSPAQAPTAVAERPAPAVSAPAQRPAPEREPLPAARKQEASRQERQSSSRESRAARRRRTGLVRMAIALAILTALLAGLTIWAVRSEKQPAAQEPEVLQLQLNEALENYLDEAPTRTRG